MSTEVKRILKRILVTGQRLGEVAGIHANEITVERKEQKDDKGNVFREWTATWWTILVERRKVKTKSKNSSQPNPLCLSEMAFELLGTPFNGFYFSSPETKTDAEGKPYIQPH